MTKIRVVLPFHLRNLARVYDDVELEISSARKQAVTLGALLDAIELRYPVLRGTIRDPDTLRRRPFVRFYACKQDLSHEPPETPLPPEIVAGAEPFIIVGAMAGG
jgi:sulfur-carrier protein